MAIPMLLAGLGGVAYYLSQNNIAIDAAGNENIPTIFQLGMLKDFMEGGIVTGTIRPFYLAFTELNEAYKPHSAPSQEGTYSLSDFFMRYGRNMAYEQTNAPGFFFKAPIAQIPLASAEQSNPNVIVPVGWAGPSGAEALGYHPRAYVEYKNEELFNSTLKNRFTTMGYNTDAGEPTETSVHVDPVDAGPINTEYNPYGPGGLLQNLFANGMAERTHKNGTDLSTILGNPWGQVRK